MTFRRASGKNLINFVSATQFPFSRSFPAREATGPKAARIRRSRLDFFGMSEEGIDLGFAHVVEVPFCSS
jgi:hypothetical protein